MADIPFFQRAHQYQLDLERQKKQKELFDKMMERELERKDLLNNSLKNDFGSSNNNFGISPENNPFKK